MRVADGPTTDGKSDRSPNIVASKPSTQVAADNMRALLAKHVLEIDAKLFNTALRGVVKYDDGRSIEINGARFDDYMAWDKKQQEKKRRDAISTEGHLLSEPQFGVQLAEKAKKRKDQQEKSEAAKKAKVEKAKEKVIEEYEKEKKKESQLAKEAVVKGLLLHCNVWTSSNDFVRACDMKELIKLNKSVLKNIDGFGLLGAPETRGSDGVFRARG